MTENRGPDPEPAGKRGPDPKPPEDDIRWLIYLAIGLVAFLDLVAWSGFHYAMGELTGSSGAGQTRRRTPVPTGFEPGAPVSGPRTCRAAGR